MLLRTIVTLGYLGFMAFTAQSILASSVDLPSLRSSRFTIAAGLPVGACLSLFARFAVERAPASHFLYVFLASACWFAVLRDPAPFTAFFSTSRRSGPSALRLCASGAGVVLSLLAMAYGYADRCAFALIAVGMAAVWPATMLGTNARTQRGQLLAQWAASMASLAVFPLLPVEKGEELRVVCVQLPSSEGLYRVLMLACVQLGRRRFARRHGDRRPPRAQERGLADLAPQSSLPPRRSAPTVPVLRSMS